MHRQRRRRRTWTGSAAPVVYGPAPIVYAGDFSNGGTANPEQCLLPFSRPGRGAARSWSAIAASIARVMKGQNVFQGGAGGLVLANVSGGSIPPWPMIRIVIPGDSRQRPADGRHPAHLAGFRLRSYRHHHRIHADHGSRAGRHHGLVQLARSQHQSGSTCSSPTLPARAWTSWPLWRTDFFDEVSLPPYQGLEIFFLEAAPPWPVRTPQERAPCCSPCTRRGRPCR